MGSKAPQYPTPEQLANRPSRPPAPPPVWRPREPKSARELAAELVVVGHEPRLYDHEPPTIIVFDVEIPVQRGYEIGERVQALRAAVRRWLEEHGHG